MSPILAVVALLVAHAVAALWVVLSYNRLVRHRNLVREAWSGIDVQLRRRHDLVPNLVAVVAGYAEFERETLEEVTRSRLATDDLEGLEDAENRLTRRLKTVLAVAEDYPQLLANRSFLDLQGQLVEIEDQLQMARRYYNGAVRDLNIRVESFPSRLVAGAFGFAAREYFQVEAATVRAAPAVALAPEAE